jgi:hypothetical protein
VASVPRAHCARPPSALSVVAPARVRDLARDRAPDGARRAPRAFNVHPRVAMQILRHSRVAITMEIYTEVASTATREALRKLGQRLEDTQT